MVIEIVAKKNDHGHQSTCGYPELVDAKSFVDITTHGHQSTLVLLIHH